MISKDMEQRLNEQLNLEFYSYYQYLSITAYFTGLSLNGFANWFAVQAEEERAHAMKIYRYLLDVDATVTLLPLPKPLEKFTTPLAAFEQSLAHERKVTAAINDLVGFALQQNDYGTHIFLQWFVTEQIEEEATARDLVEQLRLVKDSGEGLLLLDRALAARKPESEEDEES